MMALMEAPELLALIIKQQSGEQIDQGELLRALMSNPKVARPMIEGLVKSGEISFSPKLGR